MASNLSDVLGQMARAGCTPPASVDLAAAFTKYVRFRPDGERRPKKSAWVRLFEWKSPKTGRVYITGAFGNRDVQWPVESARGDWSPAERVAEMEARKAAAKATALEREKDAASAAEKAARMWEKARPFDATGTLSHPYLARKKVAGLGVRLGFNQRLLVPLRDVQGTLQGLQYIGADGAKLFGTGTVKEGRFHLVGEVADGQPLAFAEGYATAASVHMATGWPVVVCFDAGNLAPVVALWRKLYPEAEFLLCADDDRHLLPRLVERLARHGVATTAEALQRDGFAGEWQIPNGPLVRLTAGWEKCPVGTMRIVGLLAVDGIEQPLLLENAGQAKAWAVARKHKAKVLTPRFEDSPHNPGTDWNDLHCAQGLDAVRLQLVEQNATALVATGARTKALARSAGLQAAPAGVEGAEGELPLLERFTLVYGTTTVWDAQVRSLIRLESLKAAFGKRVDWWLEQPERQMVNEDHVVFDPTGERRAPQWVNLFDKFPLQPTGDRAKCSKILAHLFNLCQENEALLHWVTCWLALPLQKPGTKMRTALVLHGRTEGTGKSLLMDIMRAIYGRYGQTITQLQLQTEFTGWMSGGLFFVAEEVVSRQDRAHHKGLLQNMITNEIVQINEKNMPLRRERNHANFVFLSNDQIPMLLNARDRRYTVVRCETENQPEYFKAIGQEMEEGGIEAFYGYLLGYDIGDFSAFTRPFQNADRMHLITLGMGPDQRFFEFWRTGLAGVPFCSCPARDLYVAFKAWCRINGERFVPSSTQFGSTVGEELERIGAPRKAKLRYQAYSQRAVAEADFKDDTSAQQGIVYFVQPAAERLHSAGFEDEPEAVNPGALDDAASATSPAVFNDRIKKFQARLAETLADAKRAV